MREKASIALEALLFLGVACWQVWLMTRWLEHGNLRDIIEFTMLGLLAWWPLIRTRIGRDFGRSEPLRTS